MEIRPANVGDLASITAIYNWAIVNTTATFDTIPKTLQEQADWFEKHCEKHPIFVAEIDGQVIGWASLSSWSDRCAYADTGEVSFYVAPNFHGRGVGRALLTRLNHDAQMLGYHTLISRIADEGTVSIHLHESLGFCHVGVMKEVGRKFGRLLDVYLMQKMFD